MQKSSWYRTWFDSPYYHILYRDRDEREAAYFIDRIIKYFDPQPSAHFLDLACGKGRHSTYIHKKGYKVTGVDLSPGSIKKAQKSATEGLNFKVHDMREPVSGPQFDYVLNLFTSFGYFPTLAENEAALHTSYRALKPKGDLLIDFLNAELVIRNLVIEEEKLIDGIRFSISRSYEEGKIIKQINIDDESEKHSFKEEVKALTRPDFIGMLKRAHFEIRDTFGNYQLEKFDPETSPRLIIIARKRP